MACTKELRALEKIAVKRINSTQPSSLPKTKEIHPRNNPTIQYHQFFRERFHGLNLMPTKSNNYSHYKNT